jgi:hypothetical protein
MLFLEAIFAAISSAFLILKHVKEWINDECVERVLR